MKANYLYQTFWNQPPEFQSYDDWPAERQNYIDN